MVPESPFPAPDPPGVPQNRPAPVVNAGVENGFGIGSFVLGVVSVAPCFWVFGVGFVGGFITSFLAIAFGIIGRQKAAAGRATNGNLAVGGLVLGCIGLVIAFVITAVFLVSLIAGGR